ncbi:GTPase [Aquisphaera insulae]|uniref:GTPase n=1 Tax=Aquisphaera insulae TaxID=2712864 RepID=UPI0013EDC447|nr:GTPase [Aquisphaera insulae]
MEYSTWSRRVTELAGAVARLEAEATPLGIASPAATAWHANLFQKLRPQLTEAPYLVVAVAGGTNIGKSTVFNHLAGFPASRVHPDATQTKHPVCLVPQGFAATHDLAKVFPSFELAAWSSEDDAIADGPADRLIYREDPSGRQPANLVILDTPDVDGAMPVNWDRARLIAHASDVLIAVLTQQKFNDAAVRRFFREAAEADKTILAVFNMVEWPEDREHCERWLQTFCKGTGAHPAYVYAVPRDRVAVRENRLAFHGLTPGSTDPRDDLAELRFAEIKIRSLRGALRQMLEAREGLPAYLQTIHARAEENREARQIIHDTVRVKLDAPVLPGHIVTGEIWRWLEPRRTTFDRAVHKFYGKIGGAVMKLIPGRRDPAREEADYVRAEEALLTKALEEIYAKLDLVQRAAKPVLRDELTPVLSGEGRRRAFDELRTRLAATPLLTDAYRAAIAGDLERFEAEHPRMMRAIEWGLIATAVIRPAISIGMFGGAEMLTHAAFHVGSHSVVQVAIDVAAGAAGAAGGEGAIAGLSAPARKLIADLFAQFYKERATVLARVIHDCVLGRHLERIDGLAELAEGDDYRDAFRIAADLSRELAAIDGENAAPATESKATSPSLRNLTLPC